MRPKLDQMTAEQRIKYLEDTDHLVVKWVHRVDASGTPHYYRDTIPHMTRRLSEATLYDMKYFAGEIEGYNLVSIAKKELFEAMLKGT